MKIINDIKEINWKIMFGYLVILVVMILLFKMMDKI